MAEKATALTPTVMEPKSPKKSHQTKKWIKTQESFANKYPFRFSWPTEPKSESRQHWELRNTPLKDKLPLQKKLVPVRSIPSPGFQALELTLPSSCYSPLPLRPSWNSWELKLWSLRFSRQGPRKLPPLQPDVRCLCLQ